MQENETHEIINWTTLRPTVTDGLLADITQRIVKNFQPRQIILFGSYATGVPNTDSDLDLLVVMETTEPMAQRIRRVAEVSQVRFLPMDILVYTPEEFETRLEKGDFFIADILTKGKVLYHRKSV
jgi:uncharacterized protein